MRETLPGVLRCKFRTRELHVDVRLGQFVLRRRQIPTLEADPVQQQEEFREALAPLAGYLFHFLVAVDEAVLDYDNRQ